MMKKNKNGFTLVELIVVLAIISVLGITVGLSMNKLSQNSKDSNNETLLKEVLSSTQSYCMLVSNKDKCLNEDEINLQTIIESGYIDEKILKTKNPAKKDGTFNKEDKIIIRIEDGIKDFYYQCNDENNNDIEYFLSSIDDCTKNKDCEWSVCK